MVRTAIIAGGGVLPQLAARALRDKNEEPFVIALKGFTDKEWVRDFDHAWLKLGQVGKLIRILNKKNVSQMSFAGHMKRPSFTNFITQYGIDGTGIKLLWQIRKRKMGDDTLLRQVADFFNKRGFAIVGADKIIPDSVMPKGVLTNAVPSDEDLQDIEYATRILKEWAKLDQGQSIVVQQGLVLGVEAAEGTDELIKRCGVYKKEGRKPILVKIKKPQQDSRLDLPTVGELTVRNAVEAGFGGIAVHEGNAVFLHPSGCVSLADAHGLFLVGFEP